jgi:hypothetical protein
VGWLLANPKPLVGCIRLVAQQPKQGRRHGFSGWRWLAASGEPAGPLVGGTTDRTCRHWIKRFCGLGRKWLTGIGFSTTTVVWAERICDGRVEEHSLAVVEGL